MNFGKKKNVKGRYKCGNWNNERKKKEEQKDKERNILAMESSKVEVKEKIIMKPEEEDGNRFNTF